MAAPTVPKSKINANLNTIVAKEKSAKPTQKHVLCAEIDPWPRPPNSVEETILSKLSKILQDAPNIFHSKKLLDSDAIKTEKDRIRSQLQIGTSSVLRALERDELQGVLVSGKATPAVTVDHVISLGKVKGCPLLCLDGLSGTMATALESKSLPLSIGFRKLDDNKQSDFSEVISLIEEYTPGDRKNKESSSHSPQPFPTPVAKSSAPNKNCGKPRPLRIDASDEIEILEEVKRVFSSAVNETSLSNKDAKKKKKKQNGKKNVKEPFDQYLHPQFEAGKRTVSGTIERSRLDLVLVSQEVEEVVSTSPLFQTQTAKCPPVIVLPGLTNMLRVMTSGACHVSFLGIKKLKLFPSGSRQDFEKVLELCFKILKNEVRSNPSAEDLGHDLSSPGKEIPEKESHSSKKNDGAKNERPKEDEEDEEEEEEDYSYLYTLKKDSKDLAELRAELKTESEKAKKDSAFSLDFISLSATKPVTDSLKGKIKAASNIKPAITTQENLTSSSPSWEKTMAENVTEEESLTSDQHPGNRADSGFKPSTADETLVVGEKSSQSEPEKQSQGERKQMESSADYISFSSPLEESNTETKLTAEKQDELCAGSFSHPASGDGDQREDRERNVDKEANNAETSAVGPSTETSEVSRPTTQDASAQLFSLDRKGDKSGKPLRDQWTSHHSKKSRKPPSNSGRQGGASSKFGKVLGDEHLQQSEYKKGLDVGSLDVAARTKHQTKALKRKLDQEEGFISFKYTEANIKTMVSDPSKKRKKKKKK